MKFTGRNQKSKYLFDYLVILDLFGTEAETKLNFSGTSGTATTPHITSITCNSSPCSSPQNNSNPKTSLLQTHSCQGYTPSLIPQLHTNQFYLPFFLSFFESKFRKKLLTQKFSVRISSFGYKLLTDYLVQNDLLVVAAIINNRVIFSKISDEIMATAWKSDDFAAVLVSFDVDGKELFHKPFHDALQHVIYIIHNENEYS